MAPLWETPRMPPVPCTHAIFASSTCRASHSPRNCFAASITRKIPRIPGWFDDNPPPSGLTGKAPPIPMRPFSTKAPPSPGLQKPKHSKVTSTVMVNES